MARHILGTQALRRTRRPSLGRLSIDRTHPIAQGLILSMFNNLADVTSRNPRNQISGVAAIANAGGGITYPGLNGHAARLLSTNYQIAIDMSKHPSSTWSFRFRQTTSPTTQILMEYTANYNAKNGLAIYTEASPSRMVFAVSSNVAGSQYHAVSIPVPSTAVWHDVSVLVERTQNAGIRLVVLDGKPITTTVVTASFQLTSFDAAPLYIGARTGSVAPWDGGIQCLNIHRRHLFLDEIMALHADPYAHFLRVPFAGLGATIFEPWRPFMTQGPIF